MDSGLNIDDLISVESTITGAVALTQSVSAMLALSTSTVIDTTEGFRSYGSSGAVGVAFGVNSPEFAASVVWFSQTPTPNSFKIGAWAQAARAGRLVGGALSAAQQAIANFNAIADGGFRVAIDGGAIAETDAIVLTGVGNLNAVAAAISTTLATATVVWNASFSRFEVTSHTTGAASGVSFFTAATGVGVTDLSILLGLRSTQGGYVAPGVIPETALQAVVRFDTSYGSQFYGLAIPDAADADILAVGPYIESSARRHTYWNTTPEAGVLTPGSTVDIAAELQALGLTRTYLQYCSSGQQAALSSAAKLLAVDWTGNSTAPTLMWQDQPTVVAEALNETQAGALKAKSCNVYGDYSEDGTSGPQLLQYGVMVGGQYADTIVGVDALSIDIQTAILSTLKGAATKVAQTDAGMHDLLAAVEQICIQYVTNGFLAPGVWTSSTIANLVTNGETMSKGYKIYVAPVATQSAADRNARMAVPIQVAVKLAGAVHTANVLITVNP